MKQEDKEDRISMGLLTQPANGTGETQARKRTIAALIGSSTLKLLIRATSTHKGQEPCP